MITEDYVSFETAKLLKEKGFEGENRDWYNTEGFIEEVGVDDGIDPTAHKDIFNSIIPAPTLQMAMKWLRDEKGIAIIPVLHSVLDNEKFLWDIKIIVAETNGTYSQGWVYEEPEPGYDRAIRYCLENLI